jgi:hypothetical protein
MLKKRSVLLVKEESVYGTDPTPSASLNAILGIDVKFKETPEAVERGVDKATLGKKASLLGSIYTEISFSVEMAGSGTKGVAPRIGDLLEACGFTETVSAGSSVVYAPGSASFKSATIYAYLDGRLHIVKGARGTAKASVAAGKIGTIEFSMQGLYTAPTDVALPAATYDGIVPPVAKGCTLSLNSVTSLVVQQVEIDVGNEIAKRPSLTAVTGWAGVDITGRKAGISLDPEAVSIATYDFRADLLTTPRTFSLVLGSVAGNIMTITAPKLNVTSFEYGDRDNVLVESIKGELAENAGNDELVIAYS